MVEIVAHREHVVSCLLELISVFGSSVKPGELFTLCVSTGSSLQPALAHPKVRENATLMEQITSGSLKLQTISSIHELSALLELLHLKIPPEKRVLLLLDRLDDLFGACLGDASEADPLHEEKRKLYCSDQRVNLGRSVRPSDMTPGEDPNFVDGSGIPSAMDKFRTLLSSKHVAAVWMRSSYTQALVFGGAQKESLDNDRGTGILWSSIRVAAFPKHSPFSEAFRKLIARVILYGEGGFTE